jgi:hypothetical protein
MHHLKKERFASGGFAESAAGLPGRRSSAQRQRRVREK